MTPGICVSTLRSNCLILLKSEFMYKIQKRSVAAYLASTTATRKTKTWLLRACVEAVAMAKGAHE